jgi:hypothetical protein
VQIDPLKPVLKAFGTKRLKLQHDEPVSNFAFNFNLRRYTEGLLVFSLQWIVGRGGETSLAIASLSSNGEEAGAFVAAADPALLTVGRCRLTVSTPMVKAPMVSALEAPM